VVKDRIRKPPSGGFSLRGLASSISLVGTFATCRMTLRMSASQGKTGSELRAVKVTRLTQSGHLPHGPKPRNIWPPATSAAGLIPAGALAACARNYARRPVLTLP
jgi:hypothetical protein